MRASGRLRRGPTLSTRGGLRSSRASASLRFSFRSSSQPPPELVTATATSVSIEYSGAAGGEDVASTSTSTSTSHAAGVEAGYGYGYGYGGARAGSGAGAGAGEVSPGGTVVMNASGGAEPTSPSANARERKGSKGKSTRRRCPPRYCCSLARRPSS